MSQYSISLKSIINIESHLPPYNDDVFANTAKKLERGKQIFFPFDYTGDETFKELFENAFILNYLDESIYCLDVDLFKLNLMNEVITKAPLYYSKYQSVKALEDIALVVGDIDISSRESESITDSHNSSKGTSDSSANSSTTGKTKTSQYPQDISANKFDSVDYLDGGSVSDNVSNSTAINNSTSEDIGKNVNKLKETATNTRKNNALNKVDYYINMENNIIFDFVKSFRNLFIGIW